MAETKTRKSYDFKFKQALIKHTEEYSNRVAVRKYSVDQTVASIWERFLFTIFHLNRGFCFYYYKFLSFLEHSLLQNTFERKTQFTFYFKGAAKL